MSPGASWEPFSDDDEEYAGLIKALKATPLSEIKPHARYVWVQPIFDDSLDHIELYLVWAAAVCLKHRDAWKTTAQKRGCLE